jgi:hypothetical protein
MISKLLSFQILQIEFADVIFRHFKVLSSCATKITDGYGVLSG